MNNVYIRILSIRKHKNVTFLSGYNNEFGNIQYMIMNDIINNFKCGDLINCLVDDTINNNGKEIKQIIKVNYVIPSCNFESYKGINSKITDIKYKNYIDSRNGGKQITILKFKQELLKKIKELLDGLDFFDATTLLNNVENYKNGSGIIDAEIMNREDNEPKYLRVTLENQLKQMMAILLQSTYAIEKVYRNMGEDNQHINEFLMLEFVSISMKIDDIIILIEQLNKLSEELLIKYDIYSSNFKKLKIIDYQDLIEKSSNFEEIKSTLDNYLVINFPCNSPYIKLNENTNLKQEVRWYYNGRWISHFYEDENDFNKIKKSLDLQKTENNKNDSNQLDYFEWGLPNSTSFGLSIDRWMQNMLGEENINSVANPIELDYVKRR